MELVYLISGLVLAAVALTVRSKAVTAVANWAFYAIQAAFAIWIVIYGAGEPFLRFFRYDATGILFFSLLALIAPASYLHSRTYLDTETKRIKGMYNALCILLCISLFGVYFSVNMAVTWIFLEATTLCTAGLVYHRRTERSLEATWKYIFVCSVGIAIAYLGVLLFGGLASDGSLFYADLARSVAGGNTLFVRLAFLFILVGYSCKWEIFPLYNIGIDANFAAPTPASALISTALVNAGFVAVYRTLGVVAHSEIYDWARAVLITAGILSIVISAAFMRRTSHYKRLLSYSTVENMGIVAICLGLGRAGVIAAMIHMSGHTLLKSSMFLQLAKVGKTYGHYRVNRTGHYMQIHRGAAIMMLLTCVLLLAFPPSPLFVSELMLFRTLGTTGNWLLMVAIVLAVCAVIYNFGRHILRLCFQKSRGVTGNENAGSRTEAVVSALLVLIAVLLGLWRPEWFMDLINFTVY